MSDRDSHIDVGASAAQNDPAQSRRRLLTAADVADMLGVTAAWVYEQSRAGRIPTVTLGRYRRYRPEAIRRWVEQLER
jgi:excisionase family DNA binding protein